MRAVWGVVASLLLLAGCAQPDAEVFHRQPALTGPPGPGPLAQVEQLLAKAKHEEHSQPMAALGDCLAAVRQASDQLKLDSKNTVAIRDYNFGIARVFQIIHDAKLD